MKGDFDSFNELTASDADAVQVIENMLFMRLTRLDDNLEIVPYLAARWEFSSDYRSLTFHLRQDVFWTDGEPTTAADVVFTYRLATDPRVGYPAVSRFDLTGRVEALDAYTVRFHFKRAYPDALFDTQIPILPEHILGATPPEKIHASAFNRQPVGNGPFRLVQWRANERVVFEANERFALGRPFLDQVVFVVIPDETALLTNLLLGELDLVPALTPLGFKKVQAQSSLRGVRYAGHSFTFVGWNTARPLFSRRVRQALTLAIDGRQIIETLLEGFAQPANGPLLPHVWAYDSTLAGPGYNPEQAGRLLRQEGWRDSDGDGLLEKDGQSFVFSIKTNAGNQLRRDVAVMIQAQLRQVGVKVSIETVEWNQFIEQVFDSKDFDAVILAWDADFTVDPSPLWHSKAIENGYNFVSYHNSRVDSLLEAGRHASGRHAAKAIWTEFQRIIVDDAPYTFLFIPDQLAGINKRVRDVKMDARGFLSGVSHWWIPPELRKTEVARRR